MTHALARSHDPVDTPDGAIDCEEMLEMLADCAHALTAMRRRAALAEQAPIGPSPLETAVYDRLAFLRDLLDRRAAPVGPTRR